MNQKNKILVVDDNALNVAVFEEILAEKYNLVTASSGDGALEMLKEHRPDLILLDIMMPGIDGYETCRRLRRDPVLRFVKIILVSAKAMTSERLRGYEAGADDYVTKPFVPEELEAKVQVFLRLKHSEELDQLKTEVLRLINHETRTPLSGVLGSLELLAGDLDMAKKERKSWIDVAMTNCLLLDTLLKRALLLCELRAGKIDLTCEEIPLDNFLLAVIDEIRPLATETKVEIRLGAATGARLHGSPSHLRMAVEALLEHSVRTSPAGSQVDLEVATEERLTTLQVTDHGHGLAGFRLPQVFTDLDSPESPPPADEPAIGLALAREIIEWHGGRIEVESVSDQGTRVLVRLPLPAAEAAA